MSFPESPSLHSPRLALATGICCTKFRRWEGSSSHILSYTLKCRVGHRASRTLQIVCCSPGWRAERLDPQPPSSSWSSLFSFSACWASVLLHKERQHFSCNLSPSSKLHLGGREIPSGFQSIHSKLPCVLSSPLPAHYSFPNACPADLRLQNQTQNDPQGVFEAPGSQVEEGWCAWRSPACVVLGGWPGPPDLRGPAGEQAAGLLVPGVERLLGGLGGNLVRSGLPLLRRRAKAVPFAHHCPAGRDLPRPCQYQGGPSDFTLRWARQNHKQAKEKHDYLNQCSRTRRK